MMLVQFMVAPRLLASENVPYRPYAYWANLPEPQQFVAGLVYEESEAYHIWADGDYHNIKVTAGGEYYGIDINQGFLALQYGIAERWAADLEVGGTSLGWRSFDTNHTVQSTVGLMDWTLGFRYQLLKEIETNWTPTLTFRVALVMPGTYNQHIAFAPGLRSVALEPELLARKHFGWRGFGSYFDGAFRWNKTTLNNQYLISVGFFQQIKRWELDVGYRHLQTLTGGDIIYYPDGTINYPRDTRENNDAIEAGFSYTTSKRQIRYGFQSRTVVDGNNTDAKFWVGGSIDIPFGGKHETP